MIIAYPTNPFVLFVFGLCVAVLYGICDLFHLSYEAASVIINLIVEPLLVVPIMFAALAALLKKQLLHRFFRYIFIAELIIVAIVGIASVINIVPVLGDVLTTKQLSRINISLAQEANNTFYAHTFHATVEALNKLCAATRIDYYSLNVIVYIVAEIASIGCFAVCRRITSRRWMTGVFFVGLCCFLFSILPTLIILLK